jgi:hypothetical protein
MVADAAGTFTAQTMASTKVTIPLIAHSEMATRINWYIGGGYGQPNSDDMPSFEMVHMANSPDENMKLLLFYVARTRCLTVC